MKRFPRELGNLYIGLLNYPINELPLDDRDLMIINEINRNSSSSIAQKNLVRLGISQSAFYRRCNKLVEKRILSKSGSSPATLLINPKFLDTFPIIFVESQKMGKQDEDILKSIKDSKSKLYQPIIIRSHNFTFTLPIRRKPKYLDRKLNRKSWLEIFHVNNWSYWKGELQQFGLLGIVEIKPNIVRYYLPEIYGLHPSDNLFTAYLSLIKVKSFLEEQFKGLYLDPNRMNIRIIESSGEHHAWIHHVLSLKAKQQNISIKFANWEIDASNGFPELESTNNFQSDLHIVNELEDFEYRSKNCIYFRDLHKMINELQKDMIRDKSEFPDYSSLISAS